MTYDALIQLTRTTGLLCHHNNEPELTKLLGQVLHYMAWRPIKTLDRAGVVVELLALDPELPPLVYAASYDREFGWSVPVERRVTHWRPLGVPAK